MTGRDEIRDLIVAAAEGAAGSLAALQSAGAHLEDFEVEMGLGEGASEVAAAVRFTLAVRPPGAAPDPDR
jgi:hypothetical protein